MQDHYLPDGTTQADCDRAAGGYEIDDTCSGCGQQDCECCLLCGSTPLYWSCEPSCSNYRAPEPIKPRVGVTKPEDWDDDGIPF